MKICAACLHELPKERFSKKQWQSKQQRRCKECIAVNREVTSEAPPTDAQLRDNREPLSNADGEGASRWTDEDLFKQPPPKEECPICMLPLPSDEETRHFSCCGKVICSGCIHAIVEAEDCRDLCAFCRALPPTSYEEWMERLKKRVDADDANAICQLGIFYHNGDMGLRQNYRKANKLWLRAGELGCAGAYKHIINSYYHEEGVEMDMKKVGYYSELAAMGGCVTARYNLGVIEQVTGNMDRAVKHYMIAAGAGCDGSLRRFRELFMEGEATKDDFEKALRAHKEAKDEMKSDQREAVAASDTFDWD